MTTSHPTNDMTGGSLPAMTWQRLMDYAHQNIDLKPIPGIENPFVDPRDSPPRQPPKRSPTRRRRSGHRTSCRAVGRNDEALKEMSEEFRSAPPIGVPPKLETLSAL